MNREIVDAGHRRLLGVLAAHRVDFVLVGGVALQLKGFSGATRDVDVTIAIDTANETRLHAALEQLRAVAYLAGDRGTAYRTDLGQLEIMRRTDAIGDYSQWARNATRVDLGDGPPGARRQRLRPAGRQRGRRPRQGPTRAAAHPRRAAGPRRAATGRRARPRGRTGRRGPRRPARDPAARPASGRSGRAGLWDHAAEIITAHRTRWEIPADSRDPLGDQPGIPEQQAARAAAERQLERTLRLLSNAQAVDANAAAAVHTSQTCFPARPGSSGPTSSPPRPNARRDSPDSSLER